MDALVIKAEALDNKLNVTGSVLPNESLELKSEVSGKIISIYFKVSGLGVLVLDRHFEKKSYKKIIYLQLTLTLILVSSFCLCPNALFHTVHRYVASLSS